jgi:hypothetical protein
MHHLGHADSERRMEHNSALRISQGCMLLTKFDNFLEAIRNET